MSAATGNLPSGSAASGERPPHPVLATQQLSKVYDDGAVALDGVSLDVASGEFLVVLGPTGCGKTTLLRLIAGLDRPSGGHVLIDGAVVDHQPAQERQVAMVFQEFGLYPHLTAAENIGFPLRIGHVADAAQRVAEIAALLEIADLLDRRPHQLSGGERQRVAIGRAMVRDPKAFLLDEPLSNLDAIKRAQLRAEVGSLARELRITTVYVTHDQAEAMRLADRVAVLRRGRLQQVGAPGEVYADPANVFVAAFLGSPRPNLLQAAIYAGDGGRVDIDLGGQVIQVDGADPLAALLAEQHTQRVTVALRTEALRPVGVDATGPVVRGTARMLEDHGHETLVYLDAGVVGTATELSQLELTEPARGTVWHGAEEPAGGLLHTVSSWVLPGPRGTSAPEPTARTEYGFYPVYEEDAAPPVSDDLVVAVPAPARPRLGESLTFAVDLDRVLFFDRQGDRIRLG